MDIVLFAAVLSAVSHNSDNNNTKIDTVTSCIFQQVGAKYSNKATANIKCSDKDGIRNTDEFPAEVITNGNILRLSFEDNIISFDKNITIDTLEEETNTTSALKVYAIDAKSEETNIYSTSTLLETVKENIPPVSNAGEDKIVYINEPITIVGSGVDSDGEIISYNWIEEDTALSTSASFEYNPTTVGIHTLTLIVKDNNNDTDTDDMSLTVRNGGSDNGK